ncbi:MAG: hypothetical protein C0506_15030 [Anaerolinea sp.]|nr:hypothetical protein [Anaerolinea sp.]
MSWQEDPALQAELHRQSIRGRVLRSAIIWTPIFVLFAGLFVFYLLDTLLNGGDRGGTWVLVVILGIVTSLFGFQAMQAVLDLVGEPRKRAGEVTRRWSRTDSLVMKSHYIRLDKEIMRGDAYQLAGIKEGDYVEATYYPHSAVLIWVEKVPKPEADGESSE